jgi:hypothetical protein
LRHLLGITKLDKEKNQCIRENTGAENIVKEIKQYQEKWLQHIQRMDTNGIPKEALQNKPKGRRHKTSSIERMNYRICKILQFVGLSVEQTEKWNSSVTIIVLK